MADYAHDVGLMPCALMALHIVLPSSKATSQHCFTISPASSRTETNRSSLIEKWAITLSKYPQHYVYTIGPRPIQDHNI